MSAKYDREQNVACLVDELPQSTAVMLGYFVSAASRRLCRNTLPPRHGRVGRLLLSLCLRNVLRAAALRCTSGCGLWRAPEWTVIS